MCLSSCDLIMYTFAYTSLANKVSEQRGEIINKWMVKVQNGYGIIVNFNFIWVQIYLHMYI